jgi:uncharacterized protein YfaS (alpha-2-macroglobulin family)
VIGRHPHLIALHYTVQEQSPVRLQIFNVSGKKVTSLVDKVMAAGSYTLEWDTKNQTAGMYLAQLSIGGTVSIKPVTVRDQPIAR